MRRPAEESAASDFAPGQIRLSTEIGSSMIFANCIRNNCTWRMGFTYAALRLDFLYQTCAEHPCQGKLPPVRPETEPCPRCGNTVPVARRTKAESGSWYIPATHWIHLPGGGRRICPGSVEPFHRRADLMGAMTDA